MPFSGAGVVDWLHTSRRPSAANIQQSWQNIADLSGFPTTLAVIAQLAARRSHNPKVVRSILTDRIHMPLPPPLSPPHLSLAIYFFPLSSSLFLHISPSLTHSLILILSIPSCSLLLSSHYLHFAFPLSRNSLSPALPVSSLSRLSRSSP